MYTYSLLKPNKNSLCSVHYNRASSPFLCVHLLTLSRVALHAHRTFNWYQSTDRGSGQRRRQLEPPAQIEVIFGRQNHGHIRLGHARRARCSQIFDLRSFRPPFGSCRCCAGYFQGAWSRPVQIRLCIFCGFVLRPQVLKLSAVDLRLSADRRTAHRI